MSASDSKFLDDMARLAEDAARAARGVSREARTLFQSQIDEIIARKNLVSREQYDALAEMVALMREDMRSYEERIAALEETIKRITSEKGGKGRREN